jgi:hypothetical protein
METSLGAVDPEDEETILMPFDLLRDGVATAVGG